MRETFKIEMEGISENLQNPRKWQMQLIKIEKDFGLVDAAMAMFRKYFVEFPINGNSFEEILDGMKEYDSSFMDSPLNPFIFDEIQVPRRVSKSLHFCPPLKKQTNASFPAPMVYYIAKTAPHSVLRKLYSISKYFYAVRKVPLCFKLNVCSQKRRTPKTVSFEGTLFLSTLDLKPLENSPMLYLTDYLTLFDSPTQILTKIYKCEIKNLSLLYQTLTLSEFKFLTSLVEYAKITRGKILDENLESISTPEMVYEMPNIQKLQVVRPNRGFPANVRISKARKSVKKLKSFSYHSKYLFTDHVCNPETFCEFVKVR